MIEEALHDDAPAVQAGGNRYVSWRLSIGDVDSAMARADASSRRHTRASASITLPGA